MIQAAPHQELIGVCYPRVWSGASVLRCHHLPPAHPSLLHRQTQVGGGVHVFETESEGHMSPVLHRTLTPRLSCLWVLRPGKHDS